MEAIKLMISEEQEEMFLKQFYQIATKAIEKAHKGSNVAIAIDEKLRESDFVYKLVPRE